MSKVNLCQQGDNVVIFIILVGFAPPPALGWSGVTAPLWILELGPGLVILGLGSGEHSGLPLLGSQSNPAMSPPIELWPEFWPEPGLEQWPDPDPRKGKFGLGFQV